MTTGYRIDKTRLAAFADGELSPEEAAEVVIHLADSPEDQAYVDDLLAANAALAQAFAGPMHAPVPEAMRALILGEAAPQTARVLPFPRRAILGAGLGLAALVAASVAAVVVLMPQPDPAFVMGPMAPSDLRDAVMRQPSGQPLDLTADHALTLLASLPIPGGHCREAELLQRRSAQVTLALICDHGQGWQVELALQQALPDASGGIVPAEGDADDTAAAIGLWLDRLGAGQTLAPDAEAAAIASGWRR